MSRFTRVIVILGAVLGVWRLLIRFQKRPVYLPPADYIQHVDNVERLLGYQTVANLRDIGGYRTADGHTVRSGLLLRGASLAGVDDTELAKLAALPLRLVCDLRTPLEISAAPDRLPASARYWHLPMLQINNRWLEAARMVLVPHYLDGMLRQIYIDMIDGQTEHLGQLYRAWMQPANLPALVHCSAGKDRTGVAVALLLRVLGVPEAAVLADYSQSNRAYDYIQNLSTDVIVSLQRLGLRRSDIVALLLANPINLAAALHHTDETYGSVEGYFRTALGFSEAELTTLRNVFLAD